MQEELERMKEASQDDPSIVVQPPSRPPRRQKWKAARMKGDKYVNADVAEDALEQQSSQGSFTPATRMDILSTAIGKPDYLDACQGEPRGDYFALLRPAASLIFRRTHSPYFRISSGRVALSVPKETIVINGSFEKLPIVHPHYPLPQDMLVNLKLCIIHRAEMIGHEELVKKFNLKVLRAIAFVSMEHLKEEVKNSSLTLDTMNLAALLDTSNLLRCDHEGIASVEDLSENIGIDPRTFLIKGPRDKVGSTLAKVKRRRKGFSVKKKTLKLKAKNKRFSRRI
ncbi:hypothetical protein K1719_026629 [Acacia pycnantha]|nr:hypothetical protein K1719_026629 [Acacia pycnantha]